MKVAAQSSPGACSEATLHLSAADILAPAPPAPALSPLCIYLLQKAPAHPAAASQAALRDPSSRGGVRHCNPQRRCVWGAPTHRSGTRPATRAPPLPSHPTHLCVAETAQRSAVVQQQLCLLAIAHRERGGGVVDGRQRARLPQQVRLNIGKGGVVCGAALGGAHRGCHAHARAAAYLHAVWGVGSSGAGGSVWARPGGV